MASAPVDDAPASLIPFGKYRVALRLALAKVQSAEADDAAGKTAAAVRQINDAADAMIEAAKAMRLLLPA